MITNIHKFREKLAAGKKCLGPAITLNDPSVVEAIADSSDFVWLDMEHSPVGFPDLQSNLIAARAAGVPAMVRVPSSDTAWVKRVLDTGAEGIIVPRVYSADEVREYASACFYPPKGTRGFGPRRPSNYGRAGDGYVQHANDNLFVVVQIETVESVEDLDEILAVEGISSLVIGPFDLSGSMGMLGDVKSDAVSDVVKKVVGKAHAANVFVGMGMGNDAEHAQMAFKAGIDWIQCGSDWSYMVEFADHFYGRIRGA